MGCGCGAGGGGSIGASSRTTHISPITDQPDAECEFTESMLDNWLAKLYCAKGGDLYTTLKISRRQINSYQGILLSAKNYLDNICYFRKQLEEVESFITIITAMGQC